jgi:hypothetical protein
MVFWDHLEGRCFHDPEPIFVAGSGRTAQADQPASRLASGWPAAVRQAGGRTGSPVAGLPHASVCVYGRRRPFVWIGCACVCVWRGGGAPPPLSL